MLYLLLLPLAVIAAVLLIRQMSIQPPPAADPDTFLLSQLRQTGANLREPLPLRFHLYLPDRASAERVAGKLGEPGLRAEISPAPAGRGWLCLVSGELAPTHETMHRLRRHFEALTLAERGEYDGWEIAPERNPGEPG